MCKCGSSFTPGVKFAHRLAQEFRAIEEIVRDPDVQDCNKNPGF
jgi:hypothetical protein